MLVIDDAARSADVVAALAAGGARCVEITLRTPSAVEAIARAAAVKGVVVGAGTVIGPQDVDRVADAGARFVVTPGFDPEVVSRCLDLGLGILPGVATATEAMRAMRAGLSAVKFFPADRLGGVAMIAALAAPLAGLAFVPSGGVSADNLRAYLDHPSVCAVSGSWMAPAELMRSGDLVGIERLTRETVTLADEGRA